MPSGVYPHKRQYPPTCIIEDCDRPHHSHGWCQTHYMRWFHHGSALHPLYTKTITLCTVGGCSREAIKRGWCNTHYLRWWKHGNPLKGKHGGHKTAEYGIWHGIHTRCFNPKDRGYAHYGAIGRTMCSRWRYSFPAFYADMGPRPAGRNAQGRALYSIERIDNDGNYSCGRCEECTANGWTMNCRWATSKEQASNRRTSKHRRLPAQD